MGYQIIKQPNGKLAVFSNNSDTWVLAEGTYDEVLEYFVEMAADRARRETTQILEYVNNDEPRRAYYQFAHTFDEANKINNRHGPKVFKKGEFLGFPEGEDSE